MSLGCSRLGRLLVPWTTGRHTVLLANNRPSLDDSKGYNTDTLAVPEFINKPDWTRAVAAADKLVGHPDLFPSVQSLASELQIGEEIQSLVNTNHPLLKIAKKLVLDGRNAIPIRGLMVLLTARAFSRSSTVTSKQMNLAEITEMIHTARLIHKGVINLPAQKLELDELKLKEVEDANKISILVGDYLLANICVRLGLLTNIEVFETMSSTIRHFVEGEFLFEQDPKGVAFPSPSTTFLDWQTKSYLCSASLLAISCRCTTLLASQDKASPSHAFDFGKWFGLAWQVFTDMQSFTDEAVPPPGALDLTSLPIILHLRKDPGILNLILPFRDNLENASYDKICNVVSSGTALQEAKIIGQRYARDSMRALMHFRPSEARQALENMVSAMEDA